MRAVLTRVKNASVTIDGSIRGSIGKGFLILLGVHEEDTEAEAMKKYLMEHGIPAERIIEEDRSTDTFENMKFSKEKILEIKGKI